MKEILLKLVLLLLLSVLIKPIFAEQDCSIQLENSSQIQVDDIIRPLSKYFQLYLDTRLTLVTVEDQADIKTCHLFSSFIANDSFQQLLINTGSADYFASSKKIGKLFDQALSVQITYQMSSEEKKILLCEDYPDLISCTKKNDEKLNDKIIILEGIQDKENNAEASNEQKIYVDDSIWQFGSVIFASENTSPIGEFAQSVESENGEIFVFDNELRFGSGFDFFVSYLLNSLVGVGLTYRYINSSRQKTFNRVLTTSSLEENTGDFHVTQNVKTEFLFLTLTVQKTLIEMIKVGAELFAGGARSTSKYSVNYDSGENYISLSDYYSTNSVYGLNLFLNTGNHIGLSVRIFTSLFNSDKTVWQNYQGDKNSKNEKDKYSDISSKLYGFGFTYGI